MLVSTVVAELPSQHKAEYLCSQLNAVPYALYIISALAGAMSSMAQLGVMPESELLAPQSGAPSVPSVDKRSDFGNQSVGRGSR
eukprot:3378299-Amphidinium_carterae.1